MSEFHFIYSSVAKACVLSGFCRFKVWSVVSQDPYRKLFVLYSILVSMSSLYYAVINIYYFFVSNVFDGRAIGVSSAFLLTVFDSVYFHINNKRMNKLLIDFHKITKTLTDNDLFKTSNDSAILRTAAKFNSVFKYFSMSFVSLPALAAAFIYKNHLVYGSVDLPNPVPFDVRRYPLLYELMLTLDWSTCAACGARQIASNGFFLAILYHLRLCLEHLKSSSKYVIRKNNGSRQDGRRLHKGGVCNYEAIIKYILTVRNDRDTRNMARFKTWAKAYEDILQ